MFFFKNFFIIAFIILSFSKILHANEKIFFLDMEYVVKNTNIGKSALIKIKNINKKNIEELKKKETELKKIEENIKKKQNILSKEELDKEIKNLRDQVNLFRIEKDNMVKDINETKNKELKKLYEEINPILQSYMNENNINILLDVKHIVAGKTNSNITDDIINEINKQKN